MEKQPKNTLVHSHVYGVKAIPFYLIARKNGLKRFVIHAHTAAPALKNSNIQEKFKKIINNLISKEKLSCGIKASINIFGKKTAYSDTIVHIPNSINYHSFNTDLDIKKLKKEILDVDDDRLIIGSIARFRELKNHDFMIEVIDKLKQEQIEFIWFFAGDGLLKKDIEKKVKERRLEKYVYFLGRRDDIPELFSIMDIFTLPSLNEGLPTVVIEAQATSTTSLISDTITKECDMNLGLVEFLSIQNIEPWLDAIKMFVPKNIAKSKIEQCLIESSFTNETSAELYKNFLRKEINITIYNLLMELNNSYEKTNGSGEINLDKDYLISKDQYEKFQNIIKIKDLYIHYNNCNVFYTSEDKSSVVLIGDVIDCRDPNKTPENILNEIIELNSLEKLLEYAKYLLGRYVLLNYKNSGKIEVLPDANCTVPINYYKDDKTFVVSSSTFIISDIFVFAYIKRIFENKKQSR